ncbi:monodechloroaminopyrrolnitrin synthase PrnB family protein [Spongiactinospora sp. 9N601]|uniref:monodechloroaminopyrrolnitrin synthase PrnB family protein n=1 Tax=Spongiactinospora sp. 9N601 TaxID=3375149 RepID=UPI0037960558
MFLGSLKRHGVQPAEAVPDVVPILIELGARTDMVPRDTVHHYCTWNPIDERRRMYTGDQQENHLQESVRMVFPHLRAGLELCDLLGAFEPADPKFAVLTDALNGELRWMAESIDLVLAKVSPVFFARILRPYFEEIDVGERTYLGPAAAQVPLWLIDQAIWASDRSEPGYEEFLRDSVPYSLPRWRELYDTWVSCPSAVTRLLDAFGSDPHEAGPALTSSAAAIARMLRTVIIFRGRHLGIARQAYKEEVRLYSVGSGGASIDLLHDIITLTRENAQLMKTATEQRSADPETRGASA